MTEDWEVKLISDSFDLKQSEYDCNSTFVIFLAEEDSDYDRDDLGELILDYEELGTIDPPGPNKGFGSKIDPDFLEELWDGECRTKLSIKKLKEIGDLEELAKEIFPYMDGLFKVNKGEKIFEELPHSVDTLINFLQSKNENNFIEIVEYEDG